jgi:hypothetical protein
MTVRAWMVPTWPKVEWRIADDLTGMAQFSHISTTLLGGGGAADMPRGETVWTAPVDDCGAVYVTWEWVEARPGLVALSDPNSIFTNSEMKDLAGQPLSEWKIIQATNMVAHAVDWQQCALDAIAKARMHEVTQTADKTGVLAWRRPMGTGLPRRHARGSEIGVDAPAMTRAA